MMHWISGLDSFPHDYWTGLHMLLDRTIGKPHDYFTGLHLLLDRTIGKVSIMVSGQDVSTGLVGLMAQVATQGGGLWSECHIWACHLVGMPYMGMLYGENAIYGYTVYTLLA